MSNTIKISSFFMIGLALLAGCGGELPTEGKLLWSNGRWVRGAAPAEGSPEGHLALVHWHAEEGRNDDAIDSAEDFLENYPDDDRGEEVMMLAGQAQMASGRYMKAYGWYEKQLDAYPAGEYSDRAIYREFEIAEAFLAGRKQVVWGFLYLSAEQEALKMLSGIAEHAPGSMLAEDALIRIADHHFEKNRYAEAIEAYDGYLELFGKSIHAPYAMFRSARALHAMFEGLAYDDTPLVEADLRFGVLLESYPEIAAEAGVKDILSEIASLRAGKDYQTAQFYERVGRQSAAIFYYNQVITNYGSSKWSNKAQMDIKRLGLTVSKTPSL